MRAEPKQIRAWVNAVEQALRHAAEIAALASEVVGGEEAMVFNQARKVIRNLSGTDPDIGALGRLVIAARS
jgi:hypothetical protein